MKLSLRMLTSEAAKTRFNFEWTIEDGRWFTIEQVEGEQALAQALAYALQSHGALDFGLASFCWDENLRLTNPWMYP